MKEFKDWDIDDIVYLYRIIDSAHEFKNDKTKKLSQIINEISDLRELLGEIDIKKIGTLLKNLADIIIARGEDTKEYLGDQENT